MRNYLRLLALTCIISTSAQAEPLVLQNTDNSLSLSIYNRDLALVKDIRPANLNSGINEVIFDGVASQIQAETAIIYGDGVRVSEQNYSYNLMSYENFIHRSIGQSVRTVQFNPENGKNIYDEAELIGYANGRPILRFEYGIESDFPGRVVFDKIPAGMSNKPTLTAKLDVSKGGNKNLYLAYLTSGLSWKTDYVANVKSNDKLDLTGWVTISNNSGIDYERAKIQLIAGDVNIVRSERAMPRMMKAMAFNAVNEDSMAMGSIAPESINSYELYTLPNITTVKDKENKQIALIEKNDVKYEKEFHLHSPLYFGAHNGETFEKRHPQIIYVIENTADSNLGISIPTGIIRFYENDKNSNLQFIGSNHIANTAKEDTLRLNLGEAFNISVGGKIADVKEDEISRKPENDCTVIKTKRSYDAEITVNNAEDVENTVVIEQRFPEKPEITKESINSEGKDVYTRLWKIKVAPNSKETLTYSVDLIFSRRNCR